MTTDDERKAKDKTELKLDEVQKWLSERGMVAVSLSMLNGKQKALLAAGFSCPFEAEDELADCLAYFKNPYAEEENELSEYRPYR
jgi:hypothetical protein